mmetsp:Transcript_24103/g.29491  ORF Transcript_24103/g.29491 Transcript_24103/m.29491 type:complete len:87 (-) Transcript_24103:1147-1407(-)
MQSENNENAQEEATWQDTLVNVSKVVRKGTCSETAKVISDKTLQDSLNYMMARAEEKDGNQKHHVLVTGSLLLIGDVMKELKIDVV